jgi:hypothetical protein
MRDDRTEVPVPITVHEEADTREDAGRRHDPVTARQRLAWRAELRWRLTAHGHRHVDTARRREMREHTHGGSADRTVCAVEVRQVLVAQRRGLRVQRVRCMGGHDDHRHDDE